MDNLEPLKRAAAEAAAEQVTDGMVVGLGSGSTAIFAIEALARKISNGLRMVGIATSERTAGRAQALKIPLSDLGAHPQVDVTIDGADEVETTTLNLIKGAGGALTREKIVAQASRRLLIVVDETKLVDALGVRTPVPVEVVPFGWQATARQIEELGSTAVLRPDFITDNGNYILDCSFNGIGSARLLAERLDGITGVVEHGLFVELATQLYVGSGTGDVQVLLCNRK